ncbi:type IV toxin-antitoxin system YeeU family antitoxin, partial [Aeromonas veronii]
QARGNSGSRDDRLTFSCQCHLGEQLPIGSWGLHTQVQPRFGARAIVERSGVSLLWDRSGVYGEADEQWITDIDTVLPGFIERLSKLFQQGELLSDQDKLVTLQQGEWVCLANPKASYGYLYLDVYRQESDSVQVTKS